MHLWMRMICILEGKMLAPFWTNKGGRRDKAKLSSNSDANHSKLYDLRFSLEWTNDHSRISDDRWNGCRHWPSFPPPRILGRGDGSLVSFKRGMKSIFKIITGSQIGFSGPLTFTLLPSTTIHNERKGPHEGKKSLYVVGWSLFVLTFFLRVSW